MAKYLGNLMMSYDYYTFGMQMPGRIFNSDSYRYGFQGQEKDDEIAGTGNSYTAMFWQYDPRLGRRWNIDPRPNYSISYYATFANNPIWFTDILGDSITVAQFNDQTTEETFKEFAGTKDGLEFLADYAAKGQEIFGHKFDKAGKYHNEGIDLKLEDASFEGSNDLAVTTGGLDGGKIVDGRLKLGIKVNECRNDRELIDRVKTVAHEALLHVIEYSLDYKDNKNIDFSHDPFYERLSNTVHGSKHHFMYHYKKDTRLNHPYSTAGLRILEEVNNKNKFGYNRIDLWNRLWKFTD